MTLDDVKYGKDGKPTSESMQQAFKENTELFNQLQDKHFTTKGTMKDNALRDIFKKLMKGKQDAK